MLFCHRRPPRIVFRWFAYLGKYLWLALISGAGAGGVGLAAPAAGVVEVPVLIGLGEEWRYQKGVAAPSVPEEEWRSLDFDDASWLTGRSGFSSGWLSAEATPLLDLPSAYKSVYFRKTFELGEVALIKWLILRVDFEDSLIVYLNGQEIARRGFEPNQRVTFQSMATVPERHLGLELDLSAAIPGLRPGRNVLAVEVHTASVEDTTLLLLPELRANFTRGPFVQNVSGTGAQIIWRSPRATAAALEYGPTRDRGNVIIRTNLQTEHVFTLGNLAPGAECFYRCLSVAEGDAVASPVLSFRAMKAAGPVRFAVLGDSGIGSAAQYQVAAQLQAAQPDLVLHAGDIIYPMFTSDRADARCLSVYGRQMQAIPYFFVFGNHDLYAGEQHYLDAFFLPTNRFTGTEHFYSFDQGDAHFSMLFIPMLSQYEMRPGDVQYRWLTNDLARTAKPWKIMVLHHPVATSGPHRFDDFNFNGIRDYLDLQGVLVPLAAKYGVQLILSGHDHGYERLAPIAGVHTMVSGGGGVYLYGLRERDAASAQFHNRHHCLVVSLEGMRGRVEAVDERGEVFDAFNIYREVPPAARLTSTWHTPAMARAPANDQDGNVLGQVFDLAGDAFPARAGVFSTLGEIQVNHDSANLYLGFRGAMIRAQNDIMLFIESPGLAGRTNLAGLGNGLVDPAGEGVDGLDFLNNLGFTNFAPAIAAILGDEFADESNRGWTRGGARSGSGQGVFFLDPSFTAVPGVRLQQFNRSPQLEAVGGEENADFIQLAIPLTALGNLPASPVIKIAAVVAGAGGDTNRSTRELDSGMFGAHFRELTPGTYALEGVEVHLLPPPDADGDGAPDSLELLYGTDPQRPDSDGDGLADGWEIQYRLDPRSAVGAEGAEGDPDGDSFSNRSEAMLGTDPQDRFSLLRAAIHRGPRKEMEVSWTAGAGRAFIVEVAPFDSAGLVFAPVAEIPPSTSMTRRFSIAVDKMEPGSVFRIRLK